MGSPALRRPEGFVEAQVSHDTMRYRADITAGSLKVAESRIIADLLLRGIKEKEWKDAILTENVLQVRHPATAVRLARLIRSRLELMDAELWKLVRDGTGTVASQALLATAIKHSPLLGDFLDGVVREQYRLFHRTLSKQLWEDYLDECRAHDPDVPQWNDSTKRRLRSSVFHMLAQAGFLESTKTLKLQPVHLALPVVRYLQERHEEYVLRCLQVCS